MKKLVSGLLAGTASVALGAAMLQPAQAAPSINPSSGNAAHPQQNRPDNRPGPYTKQQDKLREKAVAALESNKAQLKQKAAGGATVKVADGEYVEFPVERSDKVLTMLSEFGEETQPGLGDTPGPAHNEIPKPNRSTDNSTIWKKDYNVGHYDSMFNGEKNSFRHYYKAQSSGRYDVSVTTEDWVKVPGNASTYGDNSVEDDGGSWKFIGDTANAWWDAQIAAGKKPAQINKYLAQFDVWDRYDFDGDGNFNEADGYIDHFQAVHAGEGEEAGADGDAIWSHRWYVNGTDFGETGPTVGGVPNLGGGAKVGKSKYFIGDYTVEPENGGLGVFAHEYGHDLGLPDYYDTKGGDNGTGFWTLMSAGSWLNENKTDIGSLPGGMGPEEKLYLGWLDYSEVKAGQKKTITLSPSEKTSEGQDQAIKVNLPDVTTRTVYTKPTEGTKAWYTNRGDNVVNTLTREVAAAANVTVDAKIWHQIEAGYDYLYVEYSTDGKNWKEIGKLDGDSGGWKAHSFSYKPGNVKSQLRFRYDTDSGTNEAGAFIDQIKVTAGSQVFQDGAESGNNGWTVKGFTTSTGTETKVTPRYYLLENRQYVGYDRTLETGPYNFSKPVSRPNWVERFPYQNGMLVWQIDWSQENNNTSVHPGEGYAMVVDQRPNSFTYPNGTSPSNRREPFDATFGLSETDEVCLHTQVEDGDGAYEALETCAKSRPGRPTFNDSDPNRYWTEENPQNSVKVAGAGVKARVVAENKDGSIKVTVNYR